MRGVSGMKNKKEAMEKTCLVESASHYNFIGIGVWHVSGAVYYGTR
jgi:hypothetical protein